MKKVTKSAKQISSKPSNAIKPKAAGKDAFGGRIGTRMSKINAVVIKSGATGATVPQVSKATGESISIVSAQLGWMVTHKKVATRKEETTADGKKVLRYFANATHKQKGTK